MLPANTAMPTWWDYTPISPEERPDLSSEEKGKEYDVKCARSYIGRTRAIYVNFIRMCAAINEGFVTGNIWGLRPDIQSFLMDKGSVTSRQPFQFPLFTPMLSRMLGLLGQVEVHARAEAATQRAQSRRTKELDAAAAFSMAALEGGPMVAEVMMDRGFTGDMAKDVEMADESYEDPVIKDINSLMSMVAEMCDLEEKREEVGQSVSVSGIGAMHCYFHDGMPRVEPLQWDEIVHDASARRSDLTDSEFVCVVKRRDITGLMAKYKASAAAMKAMEDAARAGRSDPDPRYQWPQGKPIEFICYWRDGEWVEKGFIMGPNGPEVVTIGEIDPLTQKPRYTDKDLIDPPEGYNTAGWDGKKDRRWQECIRFCSFLPREYCPKPTKGEEAKDLVLAHGKIGKPGAESRLPVFMGSWMNVGGYIVSPFTAAQSAQRVMNIVTSDIVQRISKATGRSVVFDKRALAGGGTTIKKAAQDLKEGDPIQVDATVVGGVQNAIHSVGEGMDPNIFKEFDLLAQLKTISESVTQLYDDNFGAGGSANELVGVKRLQWQQASITQQPYYDAVKSIYKQVYEWIANDARWHLLQYPALLEDIVGTEGLARFQAMEDLALEKCRVKITISPNAQQIKQATSEEAIQLLQLQLLDPVSAADSLGTSYPEELYERARVATRQMRAAAEAQAQAQQQTAMSESIGMRDAELAKQEHEMYGQLLDAGMKGEQAEIKAEAPYRQAMADWMKPPSQQ